MNHVAFKNSKSKLKINYAALLRTRKHPIVEQKAVGEWFAKLGRARRNKLMFLFNTQNCECYYCHQETYLENPKPGMAKRKKATLDHIITISRGGNDNLRNLVMACSECNTIRGDLTFESFLKQIENGLPLGLSNKEKVRLARQKRKEQRKAENPKKQNQVKIFVFYLASLLILVPEYNKIVNDYLNDNG